MTRPAEGPPDIIAWNLTRRCNLNCAHCYLDADFRRGTREDELSTADGIGVIDQIAEVNGGALLILTGGEPLLRRDVFEIARYASERGLLVAIATTGTLLSRAVLTRMALAGVQGVTISLHSCRPEAHDAFTGVRGSWEATVRGARCLAEAGLPFIIQASAMPWNAAEVPDIVELASELGARAFNLFFLVCTGRGEQMTDLLPAQHETILAHLDRLQRTSEGRIAIGARCAPQYQRIVYRADPRSSHFRAFTGGCPAATHYCRITPTGDLTPCPYLPVAVGNLKVRRLADLWREAPLLKELRGRSRLQGRCGRCEFRVLCGGCRARAFAERGDYLGEDPSCPYEPREDGTAPVVPDPAHTYGLSPTFTLPWSAQARERLERVPTFARGMVVKAAECYARERGHAAITPELLSEARANLAARVGVPFATQQRGGQPRNPRGAS